MSALRLTVNNVTATVQLDHPECEAVRTLCAALPFDSVIRHTKWSGRACELQVPGPIALPNELEQPVCSIYPGHVVMTNKNPMLIISYGDAEYRTELGVEYANHVGHLTENRDALVAALGRMHDDGDADARVELVG